LRALLAVYAARQPVDKVIRGPRTGKLHLALAHGRAGSGELVLIALHALALDEVCNIEHHFAVVQQAAAHFLIERCEEPVHLETDGSGVGLALAGAGGTFAQVGEVTPACVVAPEMAVDFTAGAIVNKDFQVHFGFAAKLLNVGKKLALVGPNGFAQAFVVVEYSAEPERKNRGMLEAIRDHPGMIHTGFVVEWVLWVIFADHHRQVTGGVEKNLVAAYSEDCFQRNGFAMPG